MRYFLAPLLCALSFAAPQDLKPYFAGRGGAALLWDLESNMLVGAWNLEDARRTLFRPGSTLKPFTLAAFLEAGLYSPKLRETCKEGPLDGVQALAYSCNEYFDKAIARMEREDFERGYARFGLNAKAPSMTLETLLQASRRLVARHREERLRPVFEGMRQAVEYGTARMAAVALTEVAGKTGTMRDSASFIGFAPASKPRYVLAIHLDSGTGGGDAAPYAAKIFAARFQQKEAAFDPRTISVRLFWQSPPNDLNLKPGKYVAGTEVLAGGVRLLAPGPLDVELRDGKYQLTSRLRMEDYVEAVLNGEAGGFRNEESRKAMAVAARTYTARFRNRHSEEGFDFCDTTHCQDARFLLKPRPEIASAVEATSGEILWYAGKPAAAYYHADSGGWLEPAGDAPYLVQRKDPWWRDVPEAHWTWSVPAKTLAAALRLTFVTQNFRVTSREASGRARGLDVFGHPAEAASFRLAIGRAMGWEKVPSRFFEVVQDGTQLRFSGRGRGHGIGMPQLSAERMAADGKTYREILAEYYPGTKLSINASGLAWQSIATPKIQLFSTNLVRDRALLPLADKELASLEAATGMTAKPTIRVYPSREAFRDAGAIAEHVQGATRGRNIKLPPGANPATLRHELLHALLESNARVQHPHWFREGLVLALLKEDGAGRLRVDGLISRVGRAKVLDFWRTRLPADELQ